MDMRRNTGREHYERRIAQQRAADKRAVKRRDNIDDWKEQDWRMFDDND